MSAFLCQYIPPDCLWETKKNSERLTFWLTALLIGCDGYLPIRPDTVRYLFNVGCAVPCFPIRLGAPTFKGFREHHHSLLCLI